MGWGGGQGEKGEKKKKKKKGETSYYVVYKEMEPAALKKTGGQGKTDHKGGFLRWALSALPIWPIYRNTHNWEMSLALGTSKRAAFGKKQLSSLHQNIY